MKTAESIKHGGNFPGWNLPVVNRALPALITTVSRWQQDVRNPCTKCRSLRAFSKCTQAKILTILSTESWKYGIVEWHDGKGEDSIPPVCLSTSSF